MKNDNPGTDSWIHESDPRFTEYYKEASQSEASLQRLRSIRDAALRVLRGNKRGNAPLDVADIGCGAGSLSVVWAELGHKLHALDVNEPLLELARSRAAAGNFEIDFRLGSATKLPWAGGSMDVCLLLELLEHVQEWELCLTESCRILKPGGLLVLTTSSKLCPLQQEFNLPLYSWYPRPLKRYFEHLSVTTRPELANYAMYPAVHWFSFYGLREFLARQGLRSMDRFDVIDLADKAAWIKSVVQAIRLVPPLRWLGQVATPGTIIFAVKQS